MIIGNWRQRQHQKWEQLVFKASQAVVPASSFNQVYLILKYLYI